MWERQAKYSGLGVSIFLFALTGGLNFNLHISDTIEESKISVHQSLITTRPRGVLPKKLGRGVRPASQNPYPIYDQTVRFSIPYL